MDPNAALAIVNDEEVSWDERGGAALDLAHWVYAGGFPPEGFTVERLLSHCDWVIRRATQETGR
jgi:hypothetical protein